MAHEITNTDNVVLNRQAAWHGLGIVVDRDMAPTEALRFGNLDWTVAQRPLYAFDNDGNKILIPSHIGNFRNDKLLGVVSRSYQVYQNHEVAAFCEALLGEADGRVVIETVGSIQGGRMVWFLLKGENFSVAHNDEIVPYVLVSNGHDGSHSFRVTPTTVRVVCSNTAHMVVPRHDQGDLGPSALVVRHIGSLQDRVAEARTALANYNETQKRTREVFEKLAAAPVADAAALQKFFADCYAADFGPIPTDPKTKADERARDRAASAFASFTKRWDDEKHLAGATWWNAFNAYSGLVQHDRKTTGKDDDARFENRVESNLFGLAQRRTEAAMQRAYRGASV